MFRLVRYFSIASLIAFAIVTAVLGVFYRQTALNDLTAVGEARNAALTQVFANALWPEFRSFVQSASSLTETELQNHPEIDRLHQAVQAQTAGLSVIKIKVYDLNGLTVYSSEEAQIGQDKSDNSGYISALDGIIATELTHRDTFSAFEGEIEDRDVISSYIPIYGESGQIEGVFEVYDDVTPLLQRINRTQVSLVLGLVATLSLLWLGLFLIVRRGERIIQEQSAERIRSEAQLSAVLNTIGESIITFQSDGRIAMTNHDVHKTWGFSEDELSEASLRTLLTESSWETLNTSIATFLQDGSTAQLETRRELSGKRKDGHIFPIEIDLAETRVGADQFFTAAIRDITARKQAADTLEAQNRLLSRVNEFTHLTVDHTIEMIKRGAHPTEVLDYMKQAQEQFKKMEKS